jgi:hypothetical protein
MKGKERRKEGKSERKMKEELINFFISNGGKIKM